MPCDNSHRFVIGKMCRAMGRAILICHAGNKSCAEGRMALEDVRVLAVEHRLNGQLSMGRQESSSYEPTNV